MDNKELIERWDVDSQLKGYASGTIKIYRDMTTKFFAQCRKNPGEINLSDLKNYLILYKEKPITINLILAGLRSFWKFLIEEGIVRENILGQIQGVKVKNGKIPIIFSEKETEKIINVQQLTVREKAILHLLADTGMRNGELQNILIKNIDIKERGILLEETKNGENRYVFFWENTAELLREYLPSRNINSPYLFHNLSGEKLKHIHINALVKKAVGIAFPFDLKKRELSHAHTFRHSFVTRWIRAGGGLTALRHIVGWKNLNMLSVYEHLDRETLRDGYDEFQKLEKEKKK